MLQATDAGSLEPEIPVAVQVSTLTDGFFLFVEYRSQHSGALLTWSDVHYENGMTGMLGNTLLVDGHPETSTLLDALLGDGESVVLDVGAPDAVRPLRAYFEVLGDRLEVSLYASATPRPTVSLAPTTAAPTQSPTREEDQCGKAKYCCDFVDVDGFGRFHKMRDGDGACCSERCSFANAADGTYLQYIAAGGQYYATPSQPCYEAGSLAFLAALDSEAMEALCAARRPSPVPTATLAPHECVADSASWYKDGSPAKDCAWVADNLERCDSKADADGVLARVGCDATCFDCAPGVVDAPAPTPTPPPAPTLAPAAAAAPTPGPTATTSPTQRPCVADSASWYKEGKPSKNCAWVAQSLHRCDSKHDDAGVYARTACDATCYQCTPDDDDDDGLDALDGASAAAGAVAALALVGVASAGAWVLKRQRRRAKAQKRAAAELTAMGRGTEQSVAAAAV